MSEFDGFDFIITEEDDVMLIIYARSGNPENPSIELKPEKESVILYRNKDDVVTLESVSKDVFGILSEEKALLITEVVPTENELEQEIKQVYEAKIL
jgi:hypothetical protein